MSCGETGIRTPETLLEFTRFPGVPLQPLEHLSYVVIYSATETRCARLTLHKLLLSKIQISASLQFVFLDYAELY